jgi:hypothetical protein
MAIMTKTAMEIEQAIAETDEIIGDLNEAKRSLALGLAPYWDKRRQIEEQILWTYDRAKNGACQFSFARSDERKAFHNALLKLAEEYGDLAEQYRDTCADIEAHVRNKKRFMLHLETMRKKGELWG